MKKLLALLLALMLVMVNVAALATEPGADTDNGDDNGSEIVTTGGENDDDEKKDDEGKTESSALSEYIDEAKVSIDTAAIKGLTLDVKIDKNVNVTSTETEGKEHTPAQTLHFEVAKGVASPDTFAAPDIEIADVAFEEGSTSEEINIKTAKDQAFTGVGVYTYQVTEYRVDEKGEKATNAAGYTYGEGFELKITVIQGKEGLEIAGIAIRQEDKKTDEIENLYEAASLTVEKTVDGNLGDQKTAMFPITATFTAADDTTVLSVIYYTYTVNGEDKEIEATIQPSAWKDGVASVTLVLAHNGSVTFENIPADVTYTVVEESEDGEDYKGITHGKSASEDASDAYNYLVDGEVDKAAALTAGSKSSVTIKNTKEITVDTGVTLETLPYVLIMTIAMAGAVLMMVRRRQEQE